MDSNSIGAEITFAASTSEIILPSNKLRLDFSIKYEYQIIQECQKINYSIQAHIYIFSALKKVITTVMMNLILRESMNLNTSKAAYQ